jgi:hypothetical protein
MIFSVCVYNKYKNTETYTHDTGNIEHFTKNKKKKVSHEELNEEFNIELAKDKKTIETFYKYGNALLENENFIDEFKKKKMNESLKIKNMKNKLSQLKENVEKSLNNKIE